MCEHPGRGGVSRGEAGKGYYYHKLSQLRCLLNAYSLFQALGKVSSLNSHDKIMKLLLIPFDKEKERSHREAVLFAKDHTAGKW